MNVVFYVLCAILHISYLRTGMKIIVNVQPIPFDIMVLYSDSHTVVFTVLCS